MQQGNKVLVRLADGSTATRLVWETAKGLVYLVSERQFGMLKDGHPAPPPIGFPIEDVTPLEEAHA